MPNTEIKVRTVYNKDGFQLNIQGSFTTEGTNRNFGLSILPTVGAPKQLVPLTAWDAPEHKASITLDSNGSYGHSWERHFLKVMLRSDQLMRIPSPYFSLPGPRLTWGPNGHLAFELLYPSGNLSADDIILKITGLYRLDGKDTFFTAPDMAFNRRL
ncbi:hypothetical protein SAMN05216532_8333 [Streptomyces sp. 2231.1]|uniref:hypothetical protein n=1 Tax=Streptomyces sp. 2231.1 TaxID=1855347 RepID=UPI00089D9CB3|nr:hypothetical protein [Streptomyces sp. 2231.1]SEE67644.1 hypothetical protein SAMN05216532_8333 [Streptomyces sp. 2231.1]